MISVLINVVVTVTTVWIWVPNVAWAIRRESPLSSGTEMQLRSINLVFVFAKNNFQFYDQHQPEHDLSYLLHLDWLVGTRRSSKNAACQPHSELSFKLFAVDSVDEGVVAAAAHGEPVEEKEHNVDIFPRVDGWMNYRCDKVDLPKKIG